jgi:hypothetical protein
MTYANEQRICIKFSLKLVKTVSEKHRMLKEAFGDTALGVLDDIRPEPRPKMWQKFDIEGIVHKKFVPPGQTVIGNFYCKVLRRLKSKHPAQTHPDNWRNNSWAQHHGGLTRRSFCCSF